jgi:cysteine desulfurase
MNAIRHLEGLGFEATLVGADENCRVSPGEVEAAIREDTVLITIMHSNNETGTLQPVDEIGEAARRHGVTFHTDAAQSAGKVEVKANSADMLTVASHKFYGPKGAGALYVRKGHEPLPIMFGAGHERGLRPGTENVPGIAGLGKAAEISKRDLETRIKDTLKLRAVLYGELEKGISGLRINGHPELTLPGTLNIVFPGTNSAETVDAIGSKVALSAGAACHGGISTPSSVLKAMGLSDEDALASLRISIGKDNTEEEIRIAAGILLETLHQTGRK